MTVVQHVEMEARVGEMLTAGRPWAWPWAFAAWRIERLLVRTLVAWSGRLLCLLLLPMLEPIWFVMDRRRLMGIDRAEVVRRVTPR